MHCWNQTVDCNRIPEIGKLHQPSAIHIKCIWLNPPITSFITITIATTTDPTKLGISKMDEFVILDSDSASTWYWKFFYKKGMRLFSRKLWWLWLIGNRTSCRPIRSVTILVIKQSGLLLRGRLILLITPMITDQIGLHSVLLPLLRKKAGKTNKISTWLYFNINF